MADQPLYVLRKPGESDIRIYHDRAEVVGVNAGGHNGVLQLSSLVPAAQTPYALMRLLVHDGYTLGGQA